MDMTPTPLAATKTAIARLGGQSATARFLGVSQSAVWKWLHVSGKLPAEYVLRVEQATGVSRHWLRPDIYPVEHAGSPNTWNGLTDRSAVVTFIKPGVSNGDTVLSVRYGNGR